MVRVEMELIGRIRERDMLAVALSSAGAGAGRGVAILGPEGAGRSALLDHVAHEAAGMGFAVLRAAATPLDAAHPFGVARRLLLPGLLDARTARDPALRSGVSALAWQVLFGTEEREVAGANGPANDSGSRDGATADRQAVSRSLFWLCWRLAERAPLALLVDDVGAADRETTGFLRYLSTQLGDAPIAVVITGHLSDRVPRGLLRVELGPMTDDEASAVFERAAPDAPPEARAACLRAAGGNAGVLVALARRIHLEQRRTGDDGVLEHLEDLTRAGLAEHLAARIDDLDDPARTLLYAMAVAGPSGHVRAEELAALDGPALDSARAQLGAIGLGVPDARAETGYLASALYDLVPAPVRDELHARAAQRLFDLGSISAAGAHLLRTRPASRPWVVDALSAAAQLALDAGAVDTGSDLLARALDEPPDPARRVGLLRRLGSAERRALRSTAADRFRDVMASSADAGERIDAGLDLAWTLHATGDALEALAAVERLEKAEREAIDGSEVRQAKVTLAFASLARMRPDTIGRARQRLEPMMVSPPAPTGTLERALLAEIAYHRALAAAHRDEVTELCLAAIGGEQLRHLSSLPVVCRHIAVLVLAWCEEFALAARAAELIRERALATGDTPSVVVGSDIAGKVEFERGNLLSGLAHVECGVRAARDGVGVLLPGLLGRRALFQVELGDIDGARASLAELPGGSERWGRSTSFHAYLLAQAMVAAASNDHRAALDLAKRCGHELAVVGNRNPGSVRWRPVAARAAKALGDPVAVELADELRANAERFGAPGALGAARLLCAEVGRDSDALSALHVAVETLRASEAALDRAKALVGLGAREMAIGSRAAGEAHLAEGGALARRLGAEPVARLAAAHLRDPADTQVRVGRLEPAERLVATLLARGMSTHEIAETLFLSVPTVERLTSQAVRVLASSTRDANGRPQPALASRAGEAGAVLIRLQGRFEVSRDGRAIDVARSPARLVKLVALAVRSVPIDEVIDRLWPDVDVDRGRERLRTLLARVRRAAGDIIDRADESLRVADGVAVDAVVFHRGVDRVLAADPGDPATLYDAMAVAASYGGELLPGDRFEPWTEAARVHQQNRYVRLLDLLAVLAEQHATPEQAAGWLALASEADPYDEDRAVRAAELWQRHGRIRAALAVLDRAEQALAEIDATLGPSADALRARLRAERHCA